MRFYFLISVLAILTSCAPKYSEYNANGFSGGMSSFKAQQKMDVQVSVPQNQNNQLKSRIIEREVLEVPNTNPLNDEESVILENSCETQMHKSVSPKIGLAKGMNEIKSALRMSDVHQNVPSYKRILSKITQPRKTIVIVVAIGVILGLLGSLVSLGYILAGRAHVGGLGLAFSLGFAALFLLGLLAYDLDIAVAKFKKRGEYLKVFGLGVLRFIVILALVLTVLGLALGLAFAR